MTALSQALTDIQAYLEVDGVKNIKVEYGTETNYKTSKSVTLKFNSNGHDFMVAITRVNSENKWE